MTTNTTNLNRREFVALTATAAATSAISTSALADSISPTKSTNPLRIPSPSLARVIPSKDDPTKARLLPNSLLTTPSQQLTSNPLLTLTPLPCVDGRLNRDASITIELHYPTPNLYANIYTAHNITIPNQSIPVYPASTKLLAPRNTLGRTTLRITQRINDRAQTKLITLNTTSPSQYLLAIPTATNSSNTSFRFTSAHRDTQGHITNLTNPMPAASSRCAYFSITISDKSTGE